MAEGARQGYLLILGPDGEERAHVQGLLFSGGMTVAVATEDDLMTIPDLTPPNLVVLDDTGLDRQGRMSCLERLQQHSALVGVPILMLSSDSDIESFTSAITRAAAYLIKPVDEDELLSAVRRLSGWTGTSENTEKRRRLRRPLLMRVEVHVKSSKKKLPGQMVDASGGGCRVEVSEAVPAGELVRVVLHTHEASTHVALGAEVRWHYHAPDGTHVLGLRFTGTTALLAGKLLGFVSTGMT